MSAPVQGERIGVLGLARSGVAAARLALTRGALVYASDLQESADTEAAAAELRTLGARAEVGRHDLEALARSSRIVLSPGIPPSAPILAAPELRKVPVIAEIEYAFEALHAPVVAITGTNGKTTVTSLVEHLLCAAEIAAEAGGNIGTALSELALRSPQPEVVVVEASSFQLGRTSAFAPAVGVVTNLAPDHLDWYASTTEYYADKAKLFQNSTAESRWVLNGEDPAVLDLAGDAQGQRYLFRTRSLPPSAELGGYLAADDWLTIRTEAGEERIVPASEMKILGAHNIANALAASLSARLMGATVEGIAAGLRSFAPLRHRLEPVVERAGVLWVNDSKATNISSARVAIRTFERPLVLLLGGRHKGEAYAELIPDLCDRVYRVIAYGEAGERIEEALGGAIEVDRMGSDFEAVLRHAADIARPGDVVLLAPACSSYDMFRNFEDRGTRFRQIVTQELE